MSAGEKRHCVIFMKWCGADWRQLPRVVWRLIDGKHLDGKAHGLGPDLRLDN